MPGDVSEHAVLVPTSLGPAGGVVCESEGPPSAALLFLHTGGHSGRSGFNGEWTRLARRLAGVGVTVLRLDLATEADSSTIGAEAYGTGPSEEKIAADCTLVRDACEWFQARTDEGLPLIVAGVCYGCRLALHLADVDPNVSTTLMLVPYFRGNSEEDRGGWKERMLRVQRDQPTADLDGGEPRRLDQVDPVVLGEFEAALRKGPAWILIGGLDATDDALALGEALGDRGLEVDIEPGKALYPGNTPDIQELVSDRVLERVGRCLALPAGSS